MTDPVTISLISAVGALFAAVLSAVTTLML